MPYATTSFTHLDDHVKEGDELPRDHPLVVARPDLFTAKPPRAPRKPKAKE